MYSCKSRAIKLELEYFTKFKLKMHGEFSGLIKSQKDKIHA